MSRTDPPIILLRSSGPAPTPCTVGAGCSTLVDVTSPPESHDLPPCATDPDEDGDPWAHYDPRPFIAAQEWTFAKTAPEMPHWYVAPHQATDRDLFYEFSRWIYAIGEKRPFTFSARTYTYSYATVDEWEYWNTRFRGGQTLVNRRRADRPAWVSAEAEESGKRPWVHPKDRQPELPF
jgi:hypothetical protein